MIVRPALLSDVPALTSLLNYYILNTPITFDLSPYTPAQRELWFAEHSDGRRYRTIVAERDGNLLGYAATGPFRKKGAYDTTVEISVACDPAAQGAGIGSRLYRVLFDEIAGEDIHRIVAAIVQPNPASNALHQRFGFRAVGLMTAVGRKFDRYWDVLWMERPLVLAGPTTR